MPYAYQLKNRQRMKRAAWLTAVLVGLLVLLFIAPTRMQGWAGLGWGSLFGPEEKLNVEAPSASPTAAQSKAPPGGHLSWPTSLEWTDDVAFGCADCDGWLWPYGFELTELDHAGLTQLEESAEASPSTPSLMANASNGSGGSSRGFGSAGRSAGGSGGSGGSGGGSGGGGGGASKAPGEASSDQVGSDSGASGSYASSASDQPIVDSVVAAGAPVEADNLLLSPISERQNGSVGPLASTDPSSRRAFSDDVLKAVDDSLVGAETIYGEGDAKKVADLVGLGLASAGSEDGGEQRIDIVPEPASLTLVVMTLAGTLYRHRRRRTASCC